MSGDSGSWRVPPLSMPNEATNQPADLHIQQQLLSVLLKQVRLVIVIIFAPTISPLSIRAGFGSCISEERQVCTNNDHQIVFSSRTNKEAAKMRLHTQAGEAGRFRMVFLLFLLICTLAMTVRARPIAEDKPAFKRRSPEPTPLPKVPTLNPSSTPDDVYEFYSPRRTSFEVSSLERRGTPIKRQDQPPVPLASLGPPRFPADIPSCPKCEERYSSLSSCMGASAVFANASSIFNNPIGYVDVIKCACTDTFQAVYPQCLDCFQHTDQCYYLGTDPQGTGANKVVSNLRNICGLGSALLGGVATANNNVGTNVPSEPGTYTDVSTTGAGYKDASTGAIFQSSGGRSAVEDAVAGWKVATLVVAVTGMAMVGGAARVIF